MLSSLLYIPTKLIGKCYIYLWEAKTGEEPALRTQKEYESQVKPS